MIRVDFNGHVVEENRGDEELLVRYCVKDRNAEGQMLVDFAKRIEVAVVNSYFKKREEHIVMYESEDRCTQVCRRCIRDCKVVSGENVAKRHHMAVCRMKLDVTTKKQVKAEAKIKWWKMRMEDSCS